MLSDDNLYGDPERSKALQLQKTPRNRKKAAKAHKTQWELNITKSHKIQWKK